MKARDYRGRCRAEGRPSGGSILRNGMRRKQNARRRRRTTTAAATAAMLLLGAAITATALTARPSFSFLTAGLDSSASEPDSASSRAPERWEGSTSSEGPVGAQGDASSESPQRDATFGGTAGAQGELANASDADALPTAQPSATPESTRSRAEGAEGKDGSASRAAARGHTTPEQARARSQASPNPSGGHTPPPGEPLRQTTSLTLSDGSHVVASAGATLRISERGGGLHLEIERGEVVLDVLSLRAAPFSITLPGAELRTRGARFHVIVRPGEERRRIDLYVMHGAVEVGSPVLGGLRRQVNEGEHWEQHQGTCHPVGPLAALHCRDLPPKT